jgi:hypothetical protein
MSAVGARPDIVADMAKPTQVTDAVEKGFDSIVARSVRL